MTNHLIASVVAGAVLASGCELPPHQFFVVQNQVPQAGCVIPSDEGVYRGEGVMDVRLINAKATDGYDVFPLVKNDLPPPAAGETAENRIDLRAFDVDVVAIGTLPAATDALLQSLDGGPLLHFRLPWSGVIDPGGGMKATRVAAISAELGRRIRDAGDLQLKGSYLELGARIRVTGDRSGTVTSDPFLFPIRVCDGCLIGNVETCPFAAAATNAGNACNVAQDDVVDCCTSGNTLICPPTVTP